MTDFLSTLVAQHKKERSMSVSMNAFINLLIKSVLIIFYGKQILSGRDPLTFLISEKVNFHLNSSQ